MMKKLTKLMVDFLQDEEGATMVEYGLMVALIAIVAIVAVSTLGENVRDKFQEVATAVGEAGTAE